jgi:two-component system nitrogen regulation sensor histidine kinase NtrY
MRAPILSRRRIVEIVAIVAVTTTLIGISRLEARLYNLSETMARDHSLLASIFYYGIINLNVFLAILLSLLVIRNIAKLLVERRRGVFGSRLRTKLVGVLIVFSLVPTVLVFYVSTRFITKSFDEWFGGRVKVTTQKTRDAGAQIYLQDQRRLESVAKVAASRVKVPLLPDFPSGKSVALNTDLAGFELEYSVQPIRVYDISGKLLNRDSAAASGRDDGQGNASVVNDMIARFVSQPAMVSASIVGVENGRDIVRAAVPVRSPSGVPLAIVMLEERFDTPVLANIQIILDGLATLKPGAQLVRVSYLILVTVMTLLIVFAAVWFGFYVARAITGPLQLLAEATKEVALGNYSIKLSSGTEDETGQLTNAFNAMTRDLLRQKNDVESARVRLEESNNELDKRRRYMEVVFENIASGVIAVDAKGVITAFNDAAIEMLGLNIENPLGARIEDVLGRPLFDGLWAQIGADTSVARELELRDFGIDATVYFAASHIQSVEGDFQGTVIVLDDATDRIRMQRATAWREVARRIAHEIKNPLTPIRLSAERLLRRFSSRFDGEDRKVFDSCVESILVQVDVLRGLVNEFSKFSRMPTIQARPASLNAIVASAIEVFRQGYPLIRFEESYADALPEALLDPEQFNRVVVNLVSNAVDAVVSRKEQGVIRIATRFDTVIGAEILEVADNGPGIPDAIRDRVFEPYFSTKEQGTGLGLAMVNQIVSDHGGYVRIARSDDAGTLFRIEIPLAENARA